MQGRVCREQKKPEIPLPTQGMHQQLLQRISE